MKFKLYYFFVALCLSSLSIVNAQFSKIDSTMKIGKAGFHFSCYNRNPDRNEIKVKPIGFDNEAREMNFYIKGRVKKTEIDDLNNDGFPDLVVYVFSNDSITMGNVLVFASQENKSFSPISLPDVLLDGKLKDGYKGNDEYTLLEGLLMRQFPIYKPGDT